MLATTTTSLFVPYIDLHDTKKKIDKIWREYKLPLVTNAPSTVYASFLTTI